MPDLTLPRGCCPEDIDRWIKQHEDRYDSFRVEPMPGNKFFVFCSRSGVGRDEDSMTIVERLIEFAYTGRIMRDHGETHREF